MTAGEQSNQQERAPGSPKKASTRQVVSTGYFSIVVGVAVLVAVSGLWVPPVVMSVALAVYLVVTGLVLRRKYRTWQANESHWRKAMPCYLSVQDRDLRILETNELFTKDFGEHIGEHCYRVYKNRDSPCSSCPVLETFTDGRTYRAEQSVVKADGEPADVIVTSTPLCDPDGNITAVAEMATNITEVKQLQAKLARAQKHFERLFDNVPCYVSVQDQQLRIVECNEMFRTDFGEGRGQYCYRVYKGRDSVCPNCPVEKTLADDKPHSSEQHVITRTGRRAEIVAYSMPIHTDSGEIDAVMEVSADITEIKKLQHELSMVGLAVAGMAHRIKNILTGLEGGIFVVNTGFEMDDQTMVDDGWDMVQRNTAKVSRIAKDLLYCSKQRVPKLEDGVALDEIARDVYELYRARAATDGIELVLNIADELPVGRFDRDGMHSLMVNLTGNALDACRFDPDIQHKEPRITISLCTDDTESTVVEVSDNGVGIAKEISGRVFRGFFSVKGTEGTGIGLLVVQRVVEAHKGTIDFKSSLGKGTTFTAVFPRQQVKAEDDGASNHSS